MLKNSLEDFVGRWRVALFFAAAGVIAFSTFTTYVAESGVFLYHEGEYVGLLWQMRAFYRGAAAFPLLIHGAVDYLPSMLAAALYGDDRVIVGTRVINTMIVWFCWGVFLDICHCVTARHAQRSLFWMGAPLVLLFLLAPPLHTKALFVHESFLGTRDVFMIVTLWCFARYLLSNQVVPDWILLVVGSASAAVALFWAYDRGIMTLAFVGAVLLRNVWERKLRDAALILGCLLLCLAILAVTNVLGSPADNLRNIVYWVRNSAEVFGTNVGMSVDDRFVAAVTFALLLLTGLIVIVDRARMDRTSGFLILGLCVVQLLLLKSILNRPVIPRLSWLIWPSVLLVIFFASRRMPPDSRDQPNGAAGDLMTEVRRYARRVPFLYKAYVVTILVLAFGALPWHVVPWVHYGAFFKNLAQAKPNSTVVPADVAEVGELLRKSGDPCVFGWVSEGVFALLAHKMNCTVYPNAIYVAAAAEHDFLQQLRKETPKVIVKDILSDAFTTKLDGRSTADRLPLVSRFIAENYPHETRIGRYLVVSR